MATDETVLHATMIIFAFFRGQDVRQLDGVTFDRFRAFISIRNARGIAEIKNIFVRQKIAQRFHDGESANSRIENADRRASEFDASVCGCWPIVALCLARYSPPLIETEGLSA